MRVCIHRGAREIGGSCVEVEASGQRIVLDVGLPLDAADDETLLPPVRGFHEPDAQLLAVVISHPHQDHYGLAHHLRPGLPVVIGEAARAILKAAHPFSPAGAEFAQVRVLHDRRPLTIGPFVLTPYLMDHSAYDAYALLIEAGSKRLFYSGDLRGHGRKAGLFERLLQQPPRAVDVLLLEGTVMGREPLNGRFTTEQELERAFVKQLRDTHGLSLVWCSSQNIDRIVTVFKACRRTERELILDLYTAEILRATGNPHLPQGDWDGVRVYLTNRQRIQVKSQGLFALLDRYEKNRIFPKELPAAAGRRSVMLFRPSFRKELEQAKCLQRARLLYSLWEGYLRDERQQPILHWLKQRDIPLIRLHTSGHASVADLKRLVRAMNPGRVVPIHTAHPEQFRAQFPHVTLQPDGTWWEV